MTNPIPRAKLLPPVLVTCWKCLGSKYFEHWRHIANGVCFTCNGTGKATIRTWTEGLRLDRSRGAVTFEHGAGRAWCLIEDGKVAHSRFPGVLDKPRPHKLSWILLLLEGLKTGGDASEIFTVSVLLASLEDEARASQRAVAFLGSKPEVATKLAEAMPAARALVAFARGLAKEAGFAPVAPYRLPKNPYAVALTTGEDYQGPVSGSEYDGLTWEGACELLARCYEEDNRAPDYFQIVKFDPKTLSWKTRDGKRAFE